MGDRCYLQMTLRRDDYEKHDLSDYFSEGVVGKNDGLMTVAEWEANWTYESELEEWAKLNIPFYGYHGPGENYGPSVFASDGKGHYAEAETNSDGHLIGVVNDDGSIDKGYKKIIETYRSVFNAAKIALGDVSDECNCSCKQPCDECDYTE